MWNVKTVNYMRQGSYKKLQPYLRTFREPNSIFKDHVPET